MNCKGSAKGMKHKINSILFSNLLRFTFSCLILTRILHLSIFLAFFIKKLIEVLVVQEKVLTLHSQFRNEL